MVKCIDCDGVLTTEERAFVNGYCKICVCLYCYRPFSKVGYEQDDMCRLCYEDVRDMVYREEKSQEEKA